MSKSRADFVPELKLTPIPEIIFAMRKGQKPLANAKMLTSIKKHALAMIKDFFLPIRSVSMPEGISNNKVVSANTPMMMPNCVRVTFDAM